MYRVPEAVWRRVEAGEPPDLYCGPVLLADGRGSRASSIRASSPRAAIATSRPTATGAPTWQRARARRAAERRLNRTPGGRRRWQPAFEAEPYPLDFEPASTALLIIDMQRDFVEPGGFGELLGNDVTPLRSMIAPCRRVLEAGRRAGLTVIHTREGHRADLTDARPPSCGAAGSRSASATGADGPRPGARRVGPRHRPRAVAAGGRTGDRQAGQGRVLRDRSRPDPANRGIRTLIVCGVTTEVCVHTTVREANDRGYECVVLSDCVGTYFPEFQRAGLG